MLYFSKVKILIALKVKVLNGELHLIWAVIILKLLLLGLWRELPILSSLRNIRSHHIWYLRFTSLNLPHYLFTEVFSLRFLLYEIHSFANISRSRGLILFLKCHSWGLIWNSFSFLRSLNRASTSGKIHLLFRHFEVNYWRTPKVIGSWGTCCRGWLILVVILVKQRGYQHQLRTCSQNHGLLLAQTLHLLHFDIHIA